MSKRKQRLAQQLGPFLRQYARPSTNPNLDPNDRQYDRGVEEQVRRLGAEEFSALLELDTERDGAAPHALALGAFVRRDARTRIRQALHADPSRVPDGWGAALDPSCPRTPCDEESTPASLEAALIAAGAAETCFVLGVDPELDGRVVALADAVRAVLGESSEAVISCIPGRLIYYRPEGATVGWVITEADRNESK